LQSTCNTRKDKLMSMEIIPPAGDLDDREAEGSAVHAVADGLTAQGYNVRDPCSEKAHCLKVTNARGTYCEVTIREDGAVSWECRPFNGSAADPAQITNMVMAILGGKNAEYQGTSPRQRPDLTLKGAVGRALRERGMRVRLAIVDEDDEPCELYAEIEVTSPATPDRGIVRVTDDGVICWECRLSGPGADDHGIDPAEIGATIGRALNRGEKATIAA
jgi:hypothetical protein